MLSSGTPLTTMQGFMTVLTQATASAGMMSEYMVEDREVLAGDDSEEDGHGYAR
jgi:hypothetical protein